MILSGVNEKTNKILTCKVDTKQEGIDLSCTLLC